MVSTAGDRTLRVWDIASGQNIKTVTLEDEEKWVCAIEGRKCNVLRGITFRKFF